MDSAALLDLLGNENRRRILRLLARKPCYVTEISEYLGVSPKAVIDHLRKLEESGLVESHVDDGRRKYFSIARNLRLEVNVSPYDFGTKSAYSASPNLDVASWRYVSLNVRRLEDEADAPDDTDAPDGSDVPEGADVPDDAEAADRTAESDADAPSDTRTAAEGAVQEEEVGTADPESGDATDVDGRAGEGTPLEGGQAGGSGGPGAGSDADDLETLAADIRELERLENELSMAQRWVQGRLTETLDRVSAHFEGVDGRFYAELLRGVACGPATAEELSRRVEAPPDVVEDALEGLSAHGVVERDGDRWKLA